LEEQERKKNRKQELEEKLLGIKPVKEDTNKRKRHDTDSESDNDSEESKPKEIPKKSLDDMKAGLQSVEELKQNIEKNQNTNKLSEKDAFDQIKAQKTIYRDKDGKAISDIQMSDLMVSKKDKLKIMNQERLNMWNKGVVQTQEKFKQKDMEELKADGDGQEYDKLVDQEYKQAHRFGDPISEIRKYQKGKATDKDKRVLWSRKIFPP
jgi:hypothetical protein